jgi:hypothetical protein
MKPFHLATITIAAMLAVALAPAVLSGATILVTSTADSGTGSLRAALASAANGDTIDATGVSGTIFLTTGELFISKSSTLLGPGPDKLSVDGNGTNRVFRVAPSNIVTISSLTIANGSGPSYSTPTNPGGGGILNDHSTLTVSNCVISGNSDISGIGEGGGIYNSGSPGSATLSLIASTLSSNLAFNGGGIFNDGGTWDDGSGSLATLMVSNCVLSGNSSFNTGSAIGNMGLNGGKAILTISASTLSSNTTGPYGEGGGIFNSAATMTMSHCVVTGNSAGGRGGGIANFSLSAQVLDSIVSSNFVTVYQGGFGGGIYNSPGARMEVVNSTLSGNHAGNGGGISNDGAQSLEIVRSTLSGNSADYWGGGIDNENSTLTVADSTLSGNSSDQGGGLNNYIGAVTVANSTLSANSARQGGGLWNLGFTNTVQILNSTFSDNHAAEAGGIYNLSGTLALGSTILNAGLSGASISNFLSSVVSLGYNLSSDSGGGALTNATDQIDTDPLLGPLQDNGGPTFTHALLCGSPAIDKGKNLGGFATDQRGLSRTFDDPLLANAAGGDGTDIGAFERQGICLESPCAGVGILVALVEDSSLPNNRKHPLLVSLEGACQSFERGHLNTGINQLQAFEHKVEAQVEKSDPALARQLIAITEAIISALGGG